MRVERDMKRAFDRRGVRGERSHVTRVTRVTLVKRPKDATSTGLGQNQAEDIAPFMDNKLSYFFAAVKAVVAENERGKLDAEKKSKEAKGEVK